MISLIDTNVVVRFLTGAKDKKYKGLYGFFASLERGERRVELKLIVLFQIIFVLTRFYKIPKSAVAGPLLDLIQYKGIAVRKKKTIRRMIELWRDNALDIVDCYLISSLEGDPGNLLYSYDRDFDKYGIRRKEP
jgi:predicted nucleic-acid-binding protein